MPELLRFRWPKEVAASLGWKTQRVRLILKKAGYHAPYKDEAKGLKILEAAGLSLARYRAKASSAEVPTKKKNGAAEKDTGTKKWYGEKPTQELTAKGRKLRATMSKKLIPRLARLLPKGDSHHGKWHARRILKEGGYRGPAWKDEMRAIQIFRDAGIDTSGFEWADPQRAREANGGDGGDGRDAIVPTAPPLAVAAPTPEDYARLADDYGKLAKAYNEMKKLMDQCQMMLEQYEHHLIDALGDKRIRTIFEPLEQPISALNVLRTPRKKSI